MRTRLTVVFAVVGLLLAMASVRAHHAFAAEFDQNKPIKVQGAVVKWELINPHGWITVEAKDASGKVVRWAIETGNPNALLRAGWRKDSLKPGDEVNLEADVIAKYVERILSTQVRSAGSAV